MDTSDLYIQMCKRAIEIQEQYTEINDGDVLRFTKSPDLTYSFKNPVCVGHHLENQVDSDYYNFFDGYDGSELFWRDDFIWLPRQDQLQKIIKDYYCHELEASEPLEPEGLLGMVQHFIKTRPFREALDVSHWSMEQIWLALVMNENYNKLWNGTDWINIIDCDHEFFNTGLRCDNKGTTWYQCKHCTKSVKSTELAGLKIINVGDV